MSLASMVSALLRWLSTSACRRGSLSAMPSWSTTSWLIPANSHVARPQHGEDDDESRC